MARGTGKVDWQEVFSDGTDPLAQAGTREEVGQKSKNVFASTTRRTNGSSPLNAGSTWPSRWGSNSSRPLPKRTSTLGSEV